MKTIKFILYFVLASFITPALAQSSSIGNGSAIAPSASQSGNYGLNAVPANDNQNTFPTRHTRRGNNPGIGSSFLQTTAPTSESSPAALPVTNLAPQRAVQFRLPKLESAFSDSNMNPALQSFSPALPKLPRTNALSNPITTSSFTTAPRNLAIENIPSFSNQPSLTDMLQFNSFDSFGK